MPRHRVSDLFDEAKEEPSIAVRARIEAARAHQLERSGGLNASLSGRDIRARCRLGSSGRRLLALSGERLHLSARGFFRVLRVARTIADLSGEAAVSDDALAEALHYRAAAADG